MTQLLLLCLAECHCPATGTNVTEGKPGHVHYESLPTGRNPNRLPLNLRARLWASYTTLFYLQAYFGAPTGGHESSNDVRVGHSLLQPCSSERKDRPLGALSLLLLTFCKLTQSESVSDACYILNMIPCRENGGTVKLAESLFKRLIIVQLVKKFSTSYWTRVNTAKCASARH
jgi:hypothetical protein